MGQSHYTPAIRQLLAEPQQRYAIPGGDTAPLVVSSRFTVTGEATGLQAQAWSDYVGRIMTVPVSRSQRQNGFFGELHTYVLKDLIFLDTRTDPVCQLRTPAHLSRDTMRDYVFHVAVQGIIETTVNGAGECKAAQYQPGVLALDMAQPMRMVRPTPARVLAFFLPRQVVEAAIPDAPSIHGRVVGFNTPLMRLLQGELQALLIQLPAPDEPTLERSLRTCVDLLLAAFARQSQVEAGSRGAVRAALQDCIRRYIDANLYTEELTVEHLLRAFPLPRPSLYRMFEEEGGLAAYIRNCRLREAAHELLLSPEMPVTEVATGLGFQSASHFSRAFRRAYGVPPLDFRALQLDWITSR